MLPLGHLWCSSDPFQFLLDYCTNFLTRLLTPFLLPALVCIVTRVSLLCQHFYLSPPGWNTFRRFSIILKSKSKCSFKAFWDLSPASLSRHTSVIPWSGQTPSRWEPFVVAEMSLASSPSLVGWFSLCVEHRSAALPFPFQLFNRALSLLLSFTFIEV